MKKLFKSSLRGFWKAKVGMILLSITVFITTFIFTLFYSTANSFNRSYENVVTQGKLHDFTVKEKYAVTGKLSGSIEQGGNAQQFLKDTPIPNTIDSKYIYMTNARPGSPLQRDDKVAAGPTSTFTIRIPKDDIVMTDSTGGDIPDTAVLGNPVVQIARDDFDHTIVNAPIVDVSKQEFGDVVKISDTGPTIIANANEGWGLPQHNYVLTTTSIAAFEKKLYGFLSDKNLVDEGVPIKINLDTSALKSTDTIFPLFSTDGKTVDSTKVEAITKAALGGKDTIIIPTSETGSDIDSWIKNDASKNNRITAAINQVILYTQAQVGNRGQSKFLADVNSAYGNDIVYSKTQSTVVTSNKHIYKLTNGAENKSVDELVVFKGDKPAAALSDKQMMSKINSFIPSSVDKSKVTYNKKGYKIIASWANGLTPANMAYTDPSSLQAVVTSDYAKQNKIKPVSSNTILQVVEKLQETAITTGASYVEALRNGIDADYKDSVIWVDATPYFITGIGTTPDFSFPIINGTNPIPNTSTQAVLFANKNGYSRILDAFRGNAHENYLGFRFNNDVSTERKQEIMNGIEAIAQKQMSWGNNVNHIVSKTDDTTEKVILAPQRITFLTKLKKTISTITYITTISLLLFTAFIVTLLVRKQINSNRKTYGILLANGYSKFEIALSNISIALIVSVVSTIIGYLAGQFSQYAFIDIFKNYWTIPVVQESFSWVALITTVVAPMIGIALLAFIITLIRLRGPILNTINEVDSRFAGGISAKLIGGMQYVGIKSKTSLSLFISNISKMFMILVAGTLAITAITVSAAEIRKFDYARTASLAATNYKFKLDLVSPTEEGGLIRKTPINYLGLKDRTHDIYSFPNPKTEIGTSNGYLGVPTDVYKDHQAFHVPAPMIDLNNPSGDVSWQYSERYTDNKIEFKSLMNIFMGISFGSSTIGTNPWDLARKKMPENQINTVDKQNQAFFNFLAKGNAKFLPDGQKTMFGKLRSYYVNKFLKNNKGLYSINSESAGGNGINTSVNQEYSQFLYLGLTSAIYEYQHTGSTEHLPYMLSYRNIIADEDDETYTHLDSSFTREDIEGVNAPTKIHVEGINEDSKNINISKEAMDSLKTYKNVSETSIPIVANKFFMAKYHFRVGDKFDSSLVNHKDRYSLGSGKLKEHAVAYTIVGTQNSYNDIKLYTLKKYANSALGWGSNMQMFNGIYTQHKNSVIFNGLPLYSVSGIYPGTDTLEPEGQNLKMEANIKKLIANKEYSDGAPWLGHANSYDQFIKTYTNSLYQIMFNNVNWALTDAYKFNSVLDLSSRLIYIIQSIILALAIIFVVIITMMLISDNKRFISTLKVMGYRRSEINRLFLGAFIPSLLIAALISAPIAIAIVYTLKVIIMSFGSILVPLAVTPWIYISVVALVIAIMYVVYILSTRGIKNTNMLNAFKE